MASVTKDARGRSPFWVMCYSDAVGRRLKKTSKTKDRGAALKMAMQLERAARLGASGSLTEHRSRELLSELLEQITDGRETVRATTARDFLVGWLDSKRALLAQGSIWSYESAVDGAIECLGQRADRPLDAVRTEDLQGFVSKLVKSGKAPKTVGIYMKVLRSAFKAARLRQLITFDPAEGVQLPRGISAERGTFTSAEIGMLLASAPSEDWRNVILLGAFTGQRLRDCTDLLWRDVDLVAGTLTFRVKKKGGARLTVPMHPQLRERLEEIAGDGKEPHVSPTLANRDTGGKIGLSFEFKAIMRAAGVEIGEAESQGSRRVSLRTFHSLRHGFVSALANAGVAEDVRMRLTGHSDANVHAGYTHRELEALRTNLEKVPRI